MAWGVHSIHAPHIMRSLYPHERWKDMQGEVGFWYTFPTEMVSAWEEHAREPGRRWSRRYRRQLWQQTPVCARQWMNCIYTLPLPTGTWYHDVDKWLKPQLLHQEMLRTEEIYAVGERFVFHSQTSLADARDSCVRHMWVEGYHALPSLPNTKSKAARIYHLLTTQLQLHADHPFGWYVFVLHGSQHWTLLMVHHREPDRIPHLSLYFDSLGSRWHPAVDEWPLPIHHVCNVPTQRDSVSCGYQVLACLAHVYGAYRGGMNMMEWMYESVVWDAEDLSYHRTMFFDEDTVCVCATLQSTPVSSWMIRALEAEGLRVPPVPRWLPLSWYQAVITYWIQVYGTGAGEEKDSLCRNPSSSV